MLTGHLHDTEGGYIHDADGRIHLFQAGAVYESSEYPNRYQYITFDWDKNEIKVNYRKFYSRSRKWVVDTEKGKGGVGTFTMFGTEKVVITSALDDIHISPFDKEVFKEYKKSALHAHRYLPTQGFETTLRIPINLERVFINMHAYIHAHDFDYTLSGQRRMQEKIRQEKFTSLDMKGAFSVSRKTGVNDMAILGTPGSGKTTLLKYILITLIEGRGRDKLGIKENLIPFFAPLRDLKEPDKESFVDFIRRACGLDDFSISSDHFTKLLSEGKGIILLDGLDEVSNEDARIKTSRWIDRARKRFVGTSFIITSRYAGYLGKSKLMDPILELSIQDFTPDEVKEFLFKWFEAVEICLHSEEDESTCKARGIEQASKLFESIGKSDHLKKLAVTPLLLQIIALVHRDRGGRLPERRVELYEEFTDVLLEKWDMAKGLDVLLTAREARRILQPLALWLHDVDGRRSAPMEEITEVIREPLEEIAKSRVDPEALLLNIRDRSGIFMRVPDALTAAGTIPVAGTPMSVFVASGLLLFNLLPFYPFLSLRPPEAGHIFLHSIYVLTFTSEIYTSLKEL